MSKAQMKSVEADEEKGDYVNLSGVFQARQAIRVKVQNGLAAIRAATLAGKEAELAIEETANQPILVSSQALASGLISKDEFSLMLCDEFGAKPTKEGKPGKTPLGYGLSVRKRSVCLSEAIGIANGEIAEEAFPKWAQGKDKEAIAEVVESLMQGTATANTAYSKLTSKEQGVTVKLPFDAAKLTKIAEALADKASLATILESPALVAVYEAITMAWEVAKGDVEA